MPLDTDNSAFTFTLVTCFVRIHAIGQGQFYLYLYLSHLFRMDSCHWIGTILPLPLSLWSNTVTIQYVRYTTFLPLLYHRPPHPPSASAWPEMEVAAFQETLSVEFRVYFWSSPRSYIYSNFAHINLSNLTLHKYEVCNILTSPLSLKSASFLNKFVFNHLQLMLFFQSD